MKLYIQYDRSAAATIRELGYPSRKNLYLWYQEYREYGDLHRTCSGKPRFSDEQKQAAVDYYVEHGGNLSGTVRALGYPSRTLLSRWIDELCPGKRKGPIRQGSAVSLTDEQKRDAVIDLCSRTGSAREVAMSVGVTPQALYAWERKLLDEGGAADMSAKNENSQSDDRDELIEEVEMLKAQVYDLQMCIHRLKPDTDSGGKRTVFPELRNQFSLTEDILDQQGHSRQTGGYHQVKGVQDAKKEDYYEAHTQTACAHL